MNEEKSILRRYLLQIILALIIVLPISTHALSIDDERWVRFYYQDPQPNQLAEWLAKMVNDGAPTNKNQFYPVFTFTSQILRQHPELANSLIEKLSNYNEEDRAFLALILWHGEIPDAKSVIAKNLSLSDEITSKITSVPPYNPIDHPVTMPSDMDMLWATFMATGNEQAVNRIIDYLATPVSSKKSTEKSKEEFITEVYLSAAEWSLESNGRQDPKVAEIIKHRFKESDDDMKAKLAPIIEGILSE